MSVQDKYSQAAKGIIDLCRLTNIFAEVYRDKVKNDGGKESDSEHSYQLAMVAWYVTQKLNLDLDLNKVFKYALVHDLVETYAGDIQSYAKSRNDGILEQVKQEEAIALERILKEFKDFPEMAKMIKDYENKVDDEAKLIKALDKLVPPVFVHLSEKDDFFIKHKVGYDEMYEERTKNAIDKSPEVHKIFDVLAQIFDDEGMFYEK